MRNLVEYHKNIGKQLLCMKDQVRNLIDNSHWLSDGEYKELILRKVIRERIGSDYHIGNGFIYYGDKNSTQIDILITRKSAPTLFQDGDFQIVTPNMVSTVIEVKAKQNLTLLGETLKKITNNAKLFLETCSSNCGFGLFSYEYESETTIEDNWATLITQELFQYPINWICLGPKYFIRFWKSGSKPGGETIDKPQYRLYAIDRMAYSYFINNVILDTNENTDYSYEKIWFPLEDGKEHYRKGILQLSEGQIESI